VEIMLETFLGSLDFWFSELKTSENRTQEIRFPNFLKFAFRTSGSSIIELK
jgi:hypothetical protein